MAKSVNPDVGFMLFLFNIRLSREEWHSLFNEPARKNMVMAAFRKSLLRDSAVGYPKAEDGRFLKRNGGKLSKEVTANKMGTGAVSKVMLSMGIPIVLSMVLQACYNIVDSMFVARMPDTGGITNAGEYAVNALTLAFPVQMSDRR